MPWQDNSGGGGRNPWGQNGGQGGGRGNNPWGQGGGGGSRGPGGPGGQGPDLDDLIRKGQERLKRMLPGGMGGARGILLLLVLFLIVWGASGIYSNKPGMRGVVTTFGQFTAITGEGLNYHLPFPIQSVEQVSVEKIHETKIDGSMLGRRGRTGSGLEETLMLTGDENIVDIQFTVFWRVSDPQRFLFNIERPQEMTVRMAAESALRDVIGRTPIEQALTTGKGVIQGETLELLQQTLDRYEAGVLVNEVQLLEVDPPQQVIAAFRDVQAAEADRERIRNEAQAYANKVIPEARGQAERMLQEAQAYREQVVARAEGQASRFLSIYDSYQGAESVTKRRMYLETMEEVLSGMDKIIVGTGTGTDGGVVPYLPLDQLNKGRAQAGGSSQGGQ
ncbi:protease FtsH subunit HflK [Rhodothalassium salexigens DSM 2132]|uniref:Protein HflK n=1 Tax=Rhodothalassium salexigens DSM 2132 TaxID=1188247 RepID=A0A4R2P7D7_RHOSA|nr:FtsH protease activity modulator HflK [Rhodothalassium salexigens]MBB4212599.1 membrane protease subunit HflK [Rhodothalassium salexigens DSM 2132]MBK1639642.1 FtsH protease activity modulator HflK [Rhodothalassium salexigens DSM 2132]TCP30803.1 protease FtsH subunit HflK [Rhodothalassium salexigens DSM 2132]